MHKVLLVNDDVTPMEFVVSVLQRNFGQSREEAERIAVHAHLNGDAVVAFIKDPQRRMARSVGQRSCRDGRDIHYGHLEK
jgi:ATP-dependent Clp protease adapter protein ClpS